MAKKQGHPIDSITFTAPKLEEVKPAEQSTPPPAHPQTTAEVETRASNVTLPVGIWEWIDTKHAEARSAGGKPLRKAAIIRAVFEAVMTVDVDLAGAQSEEDIVKRIIRATRQ